MKASATRLSRLLRRVRAAALAVLLVAGVSAAQGAPRPAAAADAPFEIYAILSLTGQNAYLGSEGMQVLQTVQDLVNKDGGIRGRPIKFVVGDDQTDAQVAVQLARSYLAKNIPALLGPGISATCKAVMPLVKDGPTTICFTPAIEPAPGGYVFSSTVSTYDTVAVGVRYFRDHGWTRLGAITSTDATGQDIDRRLDAVLALPENKDVKLVDREHFNTTDISVDAQMARIKAAHPQAIFSSATGTPFGTLLHGIRDVGLDVPVYTNASNMTYDQMGQYAGFIPKSLNFSGMLGMQDGLGPPAVRKAQNVYYAALEARGLRPTSGHNLSWDATMIVVDGFRKLGLNATAADFHRYVEGLHGWAGINGIYDFRRGDQRGVGQDSMIVFQWDAAKKDFVVVSKPGGVLK